MLPARFFSALTHADTTVHKPVARGILDAPNRTCSILEMQNFGTSRTPSPTMLKR